MQNNEEDINSDHVSLLICAGSTFFIDVDFAFFPFGHSFSQQHFSKLCPDRFRSPLRSEKNVQSWIYIHTHCGIQFIVKYGH